MPRGYEQRRKRSFEDREIRPDESIKVESVSFVGGKARCSMIVVSEGKTFPCVFEKDLQTGDIKRPKQDRAGVVRPGLWPFVLDEMNAAFAQAGF